MKSFAVIVLVGPKEEEVKRLVELLDGLFFYERHVRQVVLVDDSPQPRRLENLVRPPSGCDLVNLHSPFALRKRPSGAVGVCSPLLYGLRWLEKQAGLDFILKLDTDALVINTFSDKIAAFFAAHTSVGIIGAYRMTPGGEPRCFTQWSRVMNRLSRAIRLSPRHPFRSGPQISFALSGPKARIRSHIRAALAKGYDLGEHCLGGAYALSVPLLKKMRERGYLRNPEIWLEQAVAEDVMMGMYTKACGFHLADFVYPGAPFGVRYKGLPASPERLLHDGYSIIHSLKNDKHVSEEEAYSFFRNRRHMGVGFEYGEPQLETQPSIFLPGA